MKRRNVIRQCCADEGVIDRVGKGGAVGSEKRAGIDLKCCLKGESHENARKGMTVAWASSQYSKKRKPLKFTVISRAFDCNRGSEEST